MIGSQFLLLFVQLVELLWWSTAIQLNPSRFPRDFLFGTATSAYQVEGAWNVSGKGESIWDHLTHNYPSLIRDQSNGDVACNSYYKMEEDLKILKDLGVDFYRFSISWTRLLPTGYSTYINKDGFQYYNKLLDLLKKNDIKAMVTIYHWDLPQSLQEYGGWTNSSIIDVYVEYARVVFELFGDRVHTWITFNEPFQICVEGYGVAAKAPAWNDSGISDYICGYNLLRAHAKAFHLYNNTYRRVQKAKIGITVQAPWAEPATSSEGDVQAANRLMQFYFGWFTHPIYKGDYPETMKSHIAFRSALEGYNSSRLPQFTSEEIEYIKGTSDFFGLNHYTSIMAAELPSDMPVVPGTSIANDINLTYYYDESWPSDTNWLKVVPWGLEKLLLFIKEEYDNPDIYITENGYADQGTLNDNTRLTYYRDYLNATLNAMAQGASVKVYTAWTLMDNFEWMAGYTEKFGIVHVDYESENRTRTYKRSAYFMKHVFKKRRITGFRNRSGKLKTGDGPEAFSVSE
ncbi:myrosinase 1-like [Agrilus planipennis]|uniref:Myrosinase 1-like n=1 Tax=Agrilus planipennis TaxID=224129 RepID=A0A1W4X4B2_AGRPL|nr:myrosinase 1-like [Agrilus planipennis]